MQYTVHGQSQAKLIELGLDLKDAAFIQWFERFSDHPSMKSHDFDGVTYFWVHHEYVMKEMPILGITNAQTLGRRLTKLSEAGVLEKRVQRTHHGAVTWYAKGPKWWGLFTAPDSEVESKTALDSKVQRRPDAKVQSALDSKVQSDSPIIDSPSTSSAAVARTFPARLQAIKERVKEKHDTLTDFENNFLRDNTNTVSPTERQETILTQIENKLADKTASEKVPSGPGHPPRPDITEEEREHTKRCLEAQHEMGRILKVPHYTVPQECKRRGIWYDFTDPDTSLAEIKKAVEQPEFQSEIQFPRTPERLNSVTTEERINEA